MTIGTLLHIHATTAKGSVIRAKKTKASGFERIAIANPIVRTVSTSPGTSVKRNIRNRIPTGTLGCGVESSLLPHCEHASAFLGFTCRRGQSLTLKLRPQELQKSGSPAVTWLQLKQNFIDFT